MSFEFGSKSYKAFQDAGNVMCNEISEAMDMTSLVRKVLVCKPSLPQICKSELGEQEPLWDLGRVKEPVDKILQSVADNPLTVYDTLTLEISQLVTTFATAEAKMFTALLNKGAKPEYNIKFDKLDKACVQTMQALCHDAHIEPAILVVNRQELSDIIMFSGDTWHPITDREMILAGFIGSFDNISIVTDSGYLTNMVLEPGEWYMFGRMEHNGTALSSPMTYEDGNLIFKYGCYIDTHGFAGTFVRGHK